MVLGHLADDEVVLVVAGDRGDDVRAIGPGLAEYLPSQPSWGMTIDPISSVICVARPDRAP